MALRILTQTQWQDLAEARLDAPCGHAQLFPGDEVEAVCGKPARHLTEGKTPQERAHANAEDTRRWWPYNGDVRGMIKPGSPALTRGDAR